MPKLEETNWDDIASQELIPEGKYASRIDKVVEKQSKSSDATYWGINFTIIEEPLEGRVVWAPFMLNPEALWKLKNLFTAIGIELEGMSEIDTDDMLLQQEVGIIVTHDTYQGEVRAKVTGFYPLK